MEEGYGDAEEGLEAVFQRSWTAPPKKGAMTSKMPLSCRRRQKDVMPGGIKFVNNYLLDRNL